MSPTDIGISPAPQNPNIGLDTSTGNTTDNIMPFPTMDTDLNHDHMGSNFLDSAFFDTFTGPSPSPLRDSEGSDDTETPNEGAAPTIPGPAPDLSTNITDQVQNGPTQCPQPPVPIQAQPPNNTTGPFTMPSPSTWSSLGTMLPPGTSPTNQNLWLGSAGNPSLPKDWGVPGDDTIPQSYTEQRYTIITTIMCTTTFTITIITKAEVTHGDSWNSNVKQRPCRHMFSKTRMVHRTLDEWTQS
ncbi:hypothetical protein ACHAP8_007118 [Fusarium lateritium]